MQCVVVVGRGCGGKGGTKGHLLSLPRLTTAKSLRMLHIRWLVVLKKTASRLSLDETTSRTGAVSDRSSCAVCMAQCVHVPR